MRSNLCCPIRHELPLICLLRHSFLLAPHTSLLHGTVSCLLSNRWLLRDGGDCSDVFANSGDEAFQECDRISCPQWFDEYTPTIGQSCRSQCFTASCDWSRSKCAKERASLAKCPLFDAAVLESTAKASINRTLRFVTGGTARFAESLISVFIPIPAFIMTA
jgi:hypothetical protein